jgi:hypothetical protein
MTQVSPFPPHPKSSRPGTAISVSPEPISGEKDKARPKAKKGHLHLMRIPTLHSDTGAQWQRDNGHVRAQQHDYTCATMRACCLPSLDGTPNMTEEQTGQLAQNSASPDAGLALGHRLCLARAWEDCGARQGEHGHLLGKTSASPELSSNHDICSKGHPT